MRQKRAKQYRKQMQVLRTAFKFKTPIQCLVDDSTVLESAKTSYDLIKGINSVVQMECKFLITQCCIQHLYDSNNQLAVDLAKRMEKRRCGHKETLSSFECMKSITNVEGENKYRYLVVTQDENLRTSLRNIAGVPLVFLHRSVLVMEPLSKVTKRVVSAVERMKLTQGLNSIDAGKRSRDSDNEDGEDGEGDDQNNENRPVKKGKKVKGVNPLAMKKKQKKVVPAKSTDKQDTESNDDGKKKRRRRKHGKNSTANNENDEQSEEKSEIVANEQREDKPSEPEPVATETNPTEV
ncbi:rRNA-binding ribosome biosynthesis protein [Pichia kluyveri]|uniref:U three protein 23 n=1 Tax=Pichia kluyveri TaxID=36015 RepID=A0AAV5R728_PICKL|nr:rRNA-binding ribosome biosynthesis protein [Pichia kluyveri]